MGPGCEIPVARAYEGEHRRAEQLRKAAVEMVADAERRAANYRVQAEEIDRRAEWARAHDDFPLCRNHQAQLGFESAGLLHATEGTEDRDARVQAVAAARLDLEKGMPVRQYEGSGAVQRSKGAMRGG
jgi:hypothetical protein